MAREDALTVSLLFKLREIHPRINRRISGGREFQKGRVVEKPIAAKIRADQVRLPCEKDSSMVYVSGVQMKPENKFILEQTWIRLVELV